MTPRKSEGRRRYSTRKVSMDGSFVGLSHEPFRVKIVVERSKDGKHTGNGFS